MFVGTHLGIGGYLYQNAIPDTYKDSLFNRFYFELGNILPDISSKYSKVKHHYDLTQNYVKEHAKILQDPSTSRRQQLISLGIICHFLSDYFCTYHVRNPYKDAHIFSHLLYELKLAALFRFQLLFPRKLQEEISIESTIRYQNIKSIVLSLLTGYLREEMCCKNDILYALRATSLAILHVEEDIENPPSSETELLWWYHYSSERSLI